MSLSQTKQTFLQPVPRRGLGARVGQGGFPAGGLGTALLLWGDKRSSLWGQLGTPVGLGTENIPWPVLLICVGLALVPQHHTPCNGFTHPSISVGWGSTAQPPGLRGKTHCEGTEKAMWLQSRLQPARPCSQLVTHPSAPASWLEAPWGGENKPSKEMCPRTGGAAEPPRTIQGKSGPPPLSSAAETKPTLVRLGGLKHMPCKSGPENRVRLNLTLKDLQKLRQGPGSSTPYILALLGSTRPRGLLETTCHIHKDSLCRGNWWVRKSRGCSVLYSRSAWTSSAEKNREQCSIMNFPY